MGRFLNSTTNILFVIIKWASLLLHVWTIYIAFKIGGIIAAIFTLVFPVISQLYWCYYSYKITMFDSPFIQWTIVLTLSWIFIIVFGLLSAYIGKLEERKLDRIDAIEDYKDDLYYELSKIKPSDYAYWLEVNRETIVRVLGTKGLQEIRNHIKERGKLNAQTQPNPPHRRGV